MFLAESPAIAFARSSKCDVTEQILCQDNAELIARQGIEEVTEGCRATVGVAVLYGDSVFTMNNDCRYPMMSVFKFHVAVTVLKKMEREGIGLDSTVLFDTAKLQKDTWSPLLKERPDQIVCLSFAEILEYMVSHSDNNMCNWLIDFVGGISEVASCIRSLGIEDFRLTETEKSMQEDIYRSYCNWTTPLAMTELLRKVYTGNVLSPEHLSFLVKAMKGSSSGQNKIRSALPEGVEFAHKTGSSFRTPEGVQM